MSDWPPIPVLDYALAGQVGTTSMLTGPNSSTPTSVAWANGNRALFIPFRLFAPATVYKLIVGAGATAAGNFDVGIYDVVGNRILSSGATAKGNSVEHILDVTDTQLGAGLYYFGLALDGLNNIIALSTTAPKIRLFGVLEMNTAYPLPATATFAASTGTIIPLVNALLRPW